MRPDQLGTRDRVQLAAPVVQQDLDVAEGLEATAEAGLRAPDPLRDRPDAPAVGRVQVQNPVRLPVAQRAQHDRLRLVRAPHVSSLVRAANGLVRVLRTITAVRGKGSIVLYV